MAAKRKGRELEPIPSKVIAVPRAIATERLWGPLMWDDLHAQALDNDWVIAESAWDAKIGADLAVFRRVNGGSWDGRAVLYRQTW